MPELVPSLSDLPPRIGRYQIVCELGQGGMGTIYLARVEGIGGFERLMALKMLHPNLSRQQAFIDMLLDEARIAALIRHPNVVAVYEVGEHQGRHFIAMDYVSGESLGVLLDDTWCCGVSLDVDIVAHVLAVACDALQAAHDLVDPTGRNLELVHRDICPQNIMLGYDGITRMMDFGVAKALFRLTQTNPGTHKGKLAYAAPEYIRSASLDRRSDIFSLGVVLWESTIGLRLFKGESETLSANKVLMGRVPRPTLVREFYPPELEAIVLKALNPRPELRFQSARDMGQALRGYLAFRGSTVSASDVEALLKTACKVRHEQRVEMERRVTSASIEWSTEEHTAQLLPVGESRLPSFTDGEFPAEVSTDDGFGEERLGIARKHSGPATMRETDTAIVHRGKKLNGAPVGGSSSPLDLESSGLSVDGIEQTKDCFVPPPTLVEGPARRRRAWLLAAMLPASLLIAGTVFVIRREGPLAGAPASITTKPVPPAREFETEVVESARDIAPSGTQRAEPIEDPALLDESAAKVKDTKPSKHPVRRQPRANKVALPASVDDAEPPPTKRGRKDRKDSAPTRSYPAAEPSSTDDRLLVQPNDL